MENFNITYVRKCGACSELQSSWTPKKLDYYGNTNNSVQQILSDEMPSKEGIFYVPNLGEIVQICRDMPRMKAANVNDLALLSKMRITISSSCCNNYLNSQSMHDFWIMFWMDMQYGKSWNEGANKWT